MLDIIKYENKFERIFNYTLMLFKVLLYSSITGVSCL